MGQDNMTEAMTHYVPMGMKPNGDYDIIRLDENGYVIMSDRDKEEIAQRVVKLLQISKQWYVEPLHGEKPKVHVEISKEIVNEIVERLRNDKAEGDG